MHRSFAAGGLVVLAAVALVASAGAPTLTVEADGLRLAYRSAQLAAVAAATVALLAATTLVRNRKARLVLGLAATVVLLHAAGLAAWSLRADRNGLQSRGLLGTASLSWTEASGAVNGPGGMVISTRDGRSIAVDSGHLEPAHRAALERTIARRIDDARTR